MQLRLISFPVRQRDHLLKCILFYTMTAAKRILTTPHFDKWFASLRDQYAVRRIQARIDRVEGGHFGDCEPIGEGVSEMRIHYGPGYRVYFAQRGVKLVILLAGGDKSTQTKDIRAALTLARQV